MSLRAATSAPRAVECIGLGASRTSEMATGSSVSRMIFSKRSRKPGDIALPPLNTRGIGRLSLGMFWNAGESVFEHRYQGLHMSS